MKSYQVWLGTIIGLCGLLFSFSAGSVDGRDFPAQYALRQATVLPDSQVRLTLVLRLFNYSEEDIQGATVQLDRVLVPGEAYGTRADVDVAKGQFVDLNQQFTVDQQEYEQWQRGLNPHMTVIFTDRHGNAMQRPLEMLPDFSVNQGAL